MHNVSGIYAKPNLAYYAGRGSLSPLMQRVAQDADEDVKVILAPKAVVKESMKSNKSSRRRVVYYSMGYQPYPTLWFGRSNQHVHHHYHGVGPYPRSQKKKDDETRVLVGIVGAVAAVFAVYHLGGMIHALRDSSKNVAELKQKKMFLKHEGKKFPNDKNIQQLKLIVKTQLKIQTRVRNQCVVKVAMLISGLAAGVVMTVGAILGSTAAMAGGGIIGFGILLAAVFNWSYNKSDKAIKQDARVLEAALQQLSHPVPLENLDQRQYEPINVRKNKQPHDFEHPTVQQPYPQPYQQEPQAQQPPYSYGQQYQEPAPYEYGNEYQQPAYGYSYPPAQPSGIAAGNYYPEYKAQRDYRSI